MVPRAAAGRPRPASMASAKWSRSWSSVSAAAAAATPTSSVPVTTQVGCCSSMATSPRRGRARAERALEPCRRRRSASIRRRHDGLGEDAGDLRARLELAGRDVLAHARVHGPDEDAQHLARRGLEVRARDVAHAGVAGPRLDLVARALLGPCRRAGSAASCRPGRSGTAPGRRRRPPGRASRRSQSWLSHQTRSPGASLRSPAPSEASIPLM